MEGSASASPSNRMTHLAYLFVGARLSARPVWAGADGHQRRLRIKPHTRRPYTAPTLWLLFPVPCFFLPFHRTSIIPEDFLDLIAFLSHLARGVPDLH
ncbi:MAG: hypothetical protein KatS3mg022_0700 [Armatimonadota bacterium]|nr:MAG: hypothetical protein KatS3mg022_0700 [Armatimonadota bacterium]